LFTRTFQYLSCLSNGKIALWCYLIWYAATVVHHFDPSPSIWLNSLGISVLVGIALVLSVGGIATARANGWQTFRLFATPFCVSSFSALIKGKGFILVFPPSGLELAISTSLCAIFASTALALRRLRTSTLVS